MPHAMMRFETRGPSAVQFTQRVEQIAALFDLSASRSAYVRTEHMNDHEATELMYALLEEERQFSPDTTFKTLEILSGNHFRFFIERT